MLEHAANSDYQAKNNEGNQDPNPGRKLLWHDFTGRIDASPCLALFIGVTVVTYLLITCTDDIMGAKPLATTGRHLTIAVFRALLIAHQKVRTFVLGATPGIALKIVVAIVSVELEAGEADVGVHAGLGGTAEGGLYAVVVLVAGGRDGAGD
jgi:hypothetical protein